MRRAGGFAIGMLLLALCEGPAQAAVIEPALDAALRSIGTGETVPVIVTFPKKINPHSFDDRDKRLRRFHLLQALKEEANGGPAKVRAFAEEHGGQNIKNLWAGHALAVTANPALIREIASLPGVESIRKDSVVRVFAVKRSGTTTAPALAGPVPGSMSRPVMRRKSTASLKAESISRETREPATPASYASTTTPEWNLTAVKGPDLWALGYKGQGVVVASLDTGVDSQHPDLAGQYRGGSNSWYDPHGEHMTPADKDGHGTQAMSLALGRAGGGTAIGMAPDAQWVAVKMFNDAGFSRTSVMHQSLQWVLDPDGDASTDDAPDVVNLSWAVATVNVCNRAFQDELDALRASEIAVVMSAGNSGPGASRSISPANNPGQLSVGSVNNLSTVSNFSSRGPSACDGGLFPVLVAPGENVKAADLSFGGMPNYATVAGTSFAAPHVTGAMALLMSAVPTATLPVLESALKASAVPVGTDGASSQTGPGLIDTLAAYRAILAWDGSAWKPSGHP